jgi:hypothetical protein
MDHRQLDGRRDSLQESAEISYRPRLPLNSGMPAKPKARRGLMGCLEALRDYHVFITTTQLRGKVFSLETRESLCKLLTTKWRKRVGVEPTGDGVTRRPPVLKIT